MPQKTALLALGWILSIAVSGSAEAQFGQQTELRPYVDLTLGMAWTPDLDTDAFAPLSAQLDTQSGPNATIGAGIGAIYGISRHEIRYDYHRGTAAGITPYLELTGFTTGDPAGQSIDVQTILYYVGVREPFWDDRMAVYVMLGIGTAYGSVPLGNDMYIKDWQFGYGGTAGIFYDLWRGVGLDIGYRYAAATPFKTILVPETFVGNPLFSEEELPFQLQWSAHELLFSLRYSWGGKD